MKKMHKGQAATGAVAALVAVSQVSETMQDFLPPKYAIWALAITNIISALLPAIRQQMASQASEPKE